MAKTAVATKKNSPASTSVREDTAAVPAFMRQDAGQGPSIDRSDLEIPRIKLMQAMSPELADYDGMRAGDFFHTSAEHIFHGPFIGVPIYFEKRYILWNPRDSGGGILARADDGIHWSPSSGEFTVKLDRKDGGDTVKWKIAPTVQQSGLANWGTMNPNDPNSPPAATLMYNYVIGFPQHPDLMPAVLTFQRSSVSVGRRFNTKLMTVTGRAPMFGLLFEFSSAEATNKSGQKFFNVAARGAGYLTDEALYEQYREANRKFLEAGLSVRDIESLQGEDDETGDDEAEPGDDGGSKSGPGKRPRY